MRNGLHVGSVGAPALALVGGAILNYLIGLGGEQCEVYCGPGGLIVPVLLLGIVPLLWLLGVIFSVMEVARSRARAWWGWVGVAVSLVMPIALAVMYVISH